MLTVKKANKIKSETAKKIEDGKKKLKSFNLKDYSEDIIQELYLRLWKYANEKKVIKDGETFIPLTYNYQMKIQVEMKSMVLKETGHYKKENPTSI